MIRLFCKFCHSVIEKTGEVTSPPAGFTSGCSKSSVPQLSGLTRTHRMPTSRQPSRTCHFSLFPAISASTSTEGISTPEILNWAHFAHRSQTYSISYIPAGNPVLHTILLAWLAVPVMRGKQYLNGLVKMVLGGYWKNFTNGKNECIFTWCTEASELRRYWNKQCISLTHPEREPIATGIVTVEAAGSVRTRVRQITVQKEWIDYCITCECSLASLFKK